MTARVRSCWSTDISTLSETHCHKFLSFSQTDFWFTMYRVAFCYTNHDSLGSIDSVCWHSTLSETPLPYFSKSLTNRLLVSRVTFDESWRPVSDRVGPPTFLPSLKPTSDIFLSLLRTDFWFVGSHFAGQVVTARSDHVFYLSETHQRTDFQFVLSRFTRPIVMACDQSSQSAIISTLSESHLPYIFKSLVNWLLVCWVTFC